MAGEVSDWSRRRLLKLPAAQPSLSRVSWARRNCENENQRHSNHELTGPRTYVLVKVVADNGHYGVAEAYGLPSIGVKEQIEAFKPLLGGGNLEIDAIYTYMGIGGREFSGTRTDGSAHSLMPPPAASRWRFGIFKARPSASLQRRCWEEGSAIKSASTTMRHPATCWTKLHAGSGRQRSRRIPAALPRTRSGFAIQTRRRTVPATWAIECLPPKS